MPRKGRGGTSTGYANRTDKLTQGVSAPTGLPYGEAGQLRAAQQVAPLPQTPGAPAAAPSQPPQPGQPVDPQAIMDHLRSMSPVGLGDPTTRPNEPVTAGLPMGAGPGPEAIPQLLNRAPNPLLKGAAILNTLDLSSLPPQVRALKDAVNAQLSNQATP